MCTEPERKPLSTSKYSNNNKSKVVSISLSICVSIVLVYLFQITFNCIKCSTDLCYLNPSKHYSQVYPKTPEDRIPLDTIHQICSEGSTEMVLPSEIDSVSFLILTGNTTTSIFSLQSQDMKYFIRRLNIKVADGRLPEPNAPEIALDLRLAKNMGLAVGDTFKHSSHFTEAIQDQYLVVGLLESDIMVSVVPSYESANPEELMQHGMVVFHKPGKRNESNQFLESLDTKDLKVATYKTHYERVYKDRKNMDLFLNSVSLLFLMVLTLSVANTIYTHIFHRQDEFAFLYSIGYSRVQVKIKVFGEIALINLLGFFLGGFFTLVVSFVFHHTFLIPKGIPTDTIILPGLLQIVSIPFFTVLFSIIPTGRLINKINPLIFLEGSEL